MNANLFYRLFFCLWITISSTSLSAYSLSKQKVLPISAVHESTSKATNEFKPSTQQQINVLKAKLKSKLNNTNHDGRVAARGVGWFLLLLGIFLLFFVSMIIGAVVGLLGLILILSNAINPSANVNNVTTNNNSTTNLNPSEASSSNNQNISAPRLDELYLKNGSIIVGTITEMTSDGLVTIKTKDGKVFQFEKKEIEYFIKN